MTLKTHVSVCLLRSLWLVLWINGQSNLTLQLCLVLWYVYILWVQLDFLYQIKQWYKTFLFAVNDPNLETVAKKQMKSLEIKAQKNHTCLIKRREKDHILFILLKAAFMRAYLYTQFILLKFPQDVKQPSPFLQEGLALNSGLRGVLD